MAWRHMKSAYIQPREYADFITGLVNTRNDARFREILSVILNDVIRFTRGTESMKARKIYKKTLWRNQMETFSALLAICAGISPVTSEFPVQSPVTRSFDVFFDLRQYKRLNKQA